MLLLRAFLLMVLARIALWLLPLRWVRRVVAAGAVCDHALFAAMNTRGHRPRLQSIAEAVGSVSRFVPQASCLTQALAGQALLSGAGYRSRVEIGVAKRNGTVFESHAWVICENQVVIGGPEVRQFTSVMVWEG